jgi:hypothetical protein
MGKILCPTEYQEQVAVIEWARLMVDIGQEPRLMLLHGDSTGVRVPIGCAVKMKRAGAIKGWPDLLLAVPLVSGAGQYHCCGLFIELKRCRGGVVSPEQKTTHNLLRNQGYRVEVCHGANEAIKTIKDYLGIV